MKSVLKTIKMAPEYKARADRLAATAKIPLGKLMKDLLTGWMNEQEKKQEIGNGTEI